VYYAESSSDAARRLFEIICGCAQQIRVVFEFTAPGVAVAAQQTTNTPGHVVVVYVKSAPPGTRIW
jgi:hypothetical protein